MTEHRNLRRAIDRACAAHSGDVFIHEWGREWSYARTGVVTDAAAAGFLSLGIRPGARIAMLLPTGAEHVFAWLAAAKLGAVSCPLHTELAPGEIGAALAHLDPAAVILDRSLAPKLAGAEPLLAKLPMIAAGSRTSQTDESGGRMTSAPRRGEPGQEPAPDAEDALSRAVPFTELLASKASLEGVPEPTEDATEEILTTSGTTGRPKSAEISHRMAVLTGESFAHWLELSGSDRLFTCLPYSHINARLYSTLGAMTAGASLTLEPRFSASRFLEQLAACGATQANAIGAMLRILLERPESPDDRAHRLRLVYTAPALGKTAHLAFEARFGVRLVVGYGLTESTFGFIHPLHGDRNLESMGRPRKHPDPSLPADVRLVPLHGAPGKPAPGEPAPGEIGEVWLRNPATFTRYFRDDARTREALVDGWLRTGDLARRDALGNYIFEGRLKQIIRRRGENLTPGEVESALESHPAVLEAAVIGVPSPLGEEDVRAFIALKPGRTATAEVLAAHCAARLAPFKVPSQWRFLERLPRTSTQRIAYQLLPRD